MAPFDPNTRYDAVIVGTGFASSFFLLAFLENAAPNARVLVLERFPLRTHRWQLENREIFDDSSSRYFINSTPKKTWVFTPAFGGGTNCWWACTPRFMPNDFRMQSAYGVGRDWPVSYGDLEESYCKAEEIMSIAGTLGESPFPRSRPLPLPPHRLSKPEEMLKSAYPGLFTEMPVARPTRATARRPACCASGVCRHCPADAKFTVLNELKYLYDDPRVTLLLEAEVTRLDSASGKIDAVVFEQNGRESSAKGDLVVLGANAIFNPHLLLRSGLSHPLLGRLLHEQIGVAVVVDLDGLDNFGGSTSLSGHGYMFYDGEHRRDRAAMIVETSNIPDILRLEPGKWRRRFLVKFVIEDLPAEENFVGLGSDPRIPLVRHGDNSSYAERAIAGIPDRINELAKVLPIERIVSTERNLTQYHIQGTTVMGDDPKSSIVDRGLVHHEARNLLVLGSSVFPTCTPANPSLTISALSLWAAKRALA
jgi:choline dehydrogenase-like flavoprotein